VNKGLTLVEKAKPSKKTAIGLALIAVLAVIIMTVPDALGVAISPALKLTSLVLLSVYVVLSFEIVHRTAIALAGAAAVIIIGASTGIFEAGASFEFVTESIDFNTIGLLLGMMIIVAIMAETGVFQYLAVRMSKASRGNMWKLLVMMTVFTAVASMFIDNVTTVLLMVPVTISIFRVFRLSPVPFILAQVLASNVGGTATLIGDPPNILIGSAANIDFNAFIVNMSPSIAVTLAASLFLMKFMFRKDLAQKPENLDQLMAQDEKSLITDRGAMKKSLIVLAGVIALFVVHGSFHVEPSLIALGGAGILLVITRAKPEKVFHDVDWSTLIFFAGLFVIISGAEEAGMIGLLSNAALGITGGDPWSTFFLIIWMSAMASSFVDNIPFAATMIPLIPVLSQNGDIAAAFGGMDVSPLWWALALGVGLGGNGTLIGSSAGVVATGLAEKSGHPISFNRFMRVGFPFMIATVAIGSVVLTVDVLLRMRT
jgi:Na+/H+ antiporter NhaD/arsenite permease-like protein